MCRILKVKMAAVPCNKRTIIFLTVLYVTEVVFDCRAQPHLDLFHLPCGNSCIFLDIPPPRKKLLLEIIVLLAMKHLRFMFHHISFYSPCSSILFNRKSMKKSSCLLYSKLNLIFELNVNE